MGTFPNDDWDPDLRAEFAGRGSAKVDVLGHEVSVPPLGGPACSDECPGLLALVAERTPERRLQIALQALGPNDMAHYAVIEPLQRAGAVFDKGRCKRVALYVLRVIYPSVYTFKAFFNRARPWNCCGPNLLPMFRKGEEVFPGVVLYPGHPSYPSGHSTEAHTLANLFAMKFPAARLELLESAGRIAHNREIAGLHFPSDSRAGQGLGVDLAGAIVNAEASRQDADWTRFKADFDSL